MILDQSHVDPQWRCVVCEYGVVWCAIGSKDVGDHQRARVDRAVARLEGLLSRDTLHRKVLSR